MKAMFNKLLVLLCVLFPIILIAQTQDRSDMPWEILMFQDDVNVDQVVKKFEAEWEGKSYIKGAGIKPFRRWEYLNSNRTDENGVLNRAVYVTEFNNWKKSYTPPSGQKRSMTCPVAPTGDWTPRGPFKAVENYGIGRINALAFHPTDANQIWAAAPSGGMWVTYDYGQNWSTFTDDFGTLGFSDIAFNPLNPNTIYAATGDKDSNDAPSIGVLKSTDGGQTWNVSFSSFTTIHRLLINPVDTNYVFIATSSGVYRTVDAGANWVEVLDEYVRHMEFKANDPSVIFATEYATDARLFRSTNNGTTWPEVALPNVAKTPRRMAIGVTASNANVVYLSGGYNDPGNFNDFATLLKSTNGGASFVEVGGVPTLGSQYWYDWTMAVSPTNSNLLFAAGLGLDKSIDGGVNWSNNGSGVHVDHHYAGYHPLTGDLFVCSDGGVYYSDDNGSSWNFVNNGMSIAQYYRLSTSDTEGDLVIAGAQDNGTHLFDNGEWERVIGGDGMECIISYDDPNIIYGETQRGIIRRSLNKGVTFSTILSPSQVGESGAWVTPYIQHPTNPNILYAGYNSVHKTTDGGSSWSNSSGSLSTSTLTILAISEANPNHVFAGRSSALHRTTNGGSTWSPVNSPAGSTRYIAFDPDNENIIYAVSSFDVYRSANGGSTWSNISGSMPSVPMNCIAAPAGPNNPLYIGTDFGVYYTDDLIGDWIYFSTGLPNVIVEELEIDACQGLIRVASYGRGVWESPLYCTDVGAICCDELTPQITPFTDRAHCGGSIVLTASPGPNNYDITWYKDGNIISGANSSTYLTTEEGLYSYTFINPSNASCSSLSSEIVSITFACLIDEVCSDLNPNSGDGPGNITTVNATAPTEDIAPNKNATICISVSGDFGTSNLENFTIYDENGSNRGLTSNVADCSGHSADICFTVTATDYNQWNNDGQITVNLDPISGQINPGLCTESEACMRLYLPSSNPCPGTNNINLSGDIASATYQAAVSIISDGIVLDGSTVIFEAGQDVRLNADFEVENNAEFEARVTPCVTPPSPLESSGSQNNITPLGMYNQAVLNVK